MTAVFGAIVAVFTFLGELLGFIQKQRESAPGNATVDEAIEARRIDDDVSQMDMAALERARAKRMLDSGK